MKIQLFNRFHNNKSYVPKFVTKNGIRLIENMFAKESIDNDLVQLSTYSPDSGLYQNITFLNQAGQTYPSASHSFFVKKTKIYLRVYQ